MEQVRLQEGDFSYTETASAYFGRNKILVVEDDLAAQPLWERIISLSDPRAIVRWATTEEGAEKLIRERHNLRDEFDVVVADVMLGGTKSGIDLWKRFGGGYSQFLLVSGLSRKKFSEMLGAWSDAYPLMIQKPLNPRECIVCLRALIAYSHI
jgi:DNA-binding response OmpR family regulator